MLALLQSKSSSHKKIRNTSIVASGSAYWCPHAQLCTRKTSTPCGKEVPLDRQSMCSLLDHEQEANNNFRSESRQGGH